MPEERQPNPTVKYILNWLSNYWEEPVIAFYLNLGATTIGIAILIGVGTITFLSLRANGISDYCYFGHLDFPSTKLVLKAHRPWRTDTIYGVFNSTEEALKAAAAIGCALK